MKIGKSKNEVDKEGRTPLLIASMHFQSEIVKLLLENGADVNRGDYFDGRVRTPLDVASTREIQIILAKWPHQVEQARTLGSQAKTTDPLSEDVIAAITLPPNPEDESDLCSIQ